MMYLLLHFQLKNDFDGIVTFIVHSCSASKKSDQSPYVTVYYYRSVYKTDFDEWNIFQILETFLGPHAVADTANSMSSHRDQGYNPSCMCLVQVPLKQPTPSCKNVYTTTLKSQASLTERPRVKWK